MAQPLRIRQFWPHAVFVGLILVHLLPVWLFHYFPSQDGPAHVENAIIVRDYSTAIGQTYRRYYALNHVLEPNYLSHGILAVLSTVVAPDQAHKLLISFFVIGLPISAWYACNGVRRGSGPMAMLIFPFIYGLALQKGVYNFCLSLALFFWAVGFYLCHRELKPWSWIALAGLAIGTYYTHVVSFMMAVITVAVLVCGELFITGPEGVQSLKRRLTKAIIALLAFAPAMLLASLFFKRHASERQYLSFFELTIQLGSLSALVSYGRLETYVALLLAMTLAASVAILLLQKYRARTWNQRDLLLFAAAAATIVYFVSPNAAAGGSQISFRLSLFPWMLLILWLADAAMQRALCCLLIGAGIAASISMVVTNIRVYQNLNDYLEEFGAAGPYISEGKTFLPVFRTRFDYYPNGAGISSKVRPFVHAGGIIAVNRNAIDLSNYEANTGYFPVMFRDEVNPAVLLDQTETDLLNYPKRTNGVGSIDYVLVWDTSGGRVPTWAEAQRRFTTLPPQLEVGYELIYTSPREYVHLYRRRLAEGN